MAMLAFRTIQSLLSLSLAIFNAILSHNLARTALQHARARVLWGRDGGAADYITSPVSIRAASYARKKTPPGD